MTGPKKPTYGELAAIYREANGELTGKAQPITTPRIFRAMQAAITRWGEQSAGATFQQRVQPWLLECFGAEIAADRTERNHRFLEESLELVQALGCTASEAHQLVDYVFGRPVGDPPQEVGGVMVTLAALCLANGLDMHDAGEVELSRISVPELVAKIRAKQAAKPKHSPLPVAHPSKPTPVRGALTPEQTTAAAKKLAECMDYPWEHMPEQGRAEMRKHAQSVIEAANSGKGARDGSL